MKENKYDDQVFFEKYGEMDRSKKGLEGAGEWSTLQSLLPNFKDTTLLDLGCGYGWHCIYALQKGATRTVGLDISEKMLETAREKTNSEKAEYICTPIEEYAYPKESFDIVLSSLAFHYVKDFSDIANKVYQTLKPGGTFVFSVEHPVFTAKGPQAWVKDEAGNKLHWPVDDYFLEGKRNTFFLGEPVVKYHKTLTTYLNSLLKAGFTIEEIVEPEPDKEMLDTVEGMRDELRRPMMLIVKAVKK